jgi:hypothetical protein
MLRARAPPFFERDRRKAYRFVDPWASAPDACIVRITRIKQFFPAAAKSACIKSLFDA